MNSATRKNRVAGLIASFSAPVGWDNAFDFGCMALPLEHSRMIVNGTEGPIGTALDRANAVRKSTLIKRGQLKGVSQQILTRLRGGENSQG